MKVALLGLPQAGKRTLFHLLTSRAVPPGRQEHESVEGVAQVRDPRVDSIAALVKPQKMKYAEVMYVLCPDIRQGEPEREWLDPARQCDLLCMIVRSFKDESVYHPAGSVDPERDRTNLKTELLLADLEMVEKRLERIAKEKRAGQSQAQILEEKTLVKCREMIEAEKELRGLDLDPLEMASVKSLGLFTFKPVVWTFNVAENEVGDKASEPLSIKMSCKIEQEIMDIDSAEERKAYLAEMGLSTSGVDRMNSLVYDALGLMSFYTMGEDEVRAWTIRKGTPAPAAAGKVHSDMERGFIRVEIIRYDDLMSLGSESAVKERGKALLKGKDYVIADGDICCFRFNV